MVLRDLFKACTQCQATSELGLCRRETEQIAHDALGRRDFPLRGVDNDESGDFADAKYCSLAPDERGNQ